MHTTSKEHTQRIRKEAKQKPDNLQDLQRRLVFAEPAQFAELLKISDQGERRKYIASLNSTGTSTQKWLSRLFKED